MKKIADGIYVHRKQFITREEVGWSEFEEREPEEIFGEKYLEDET